MHNKMELDVHAIVKFRLFRYRAITAGTVFALAVLGAETQPAVTSVSPFVGAAGSVVKARVRGKHLEHARAVQFSGAGLAAKVLNVTSETADLEIRLSAEASAGPQTLRLITADGVTNELNFEVAAERIREEGADGDLQIPSITAGTIKGPGETDTYWLNVAGGETYTIEARAESESFDPSLTLLEPSGSWFDPKRLNRIAFNDEPLHFPGLAHGARIVHTFAKPGRYAVSIGGFSGQGGPDCVYALRVIRGTAADPSLHPISTASWDEHRFVRVLASDWLRQVESRGAPAKPVDRTPETWQAVDAGAAEFPQVHLPAVINGRISRPAQIQRVDLRIDSAQDLALEIETPRATMPLFNPVVRLLDSDGNEIVTNVYTKLNNNGLYMMKMIHPKATFALRSAGNYRIEIRDITTDRAGEDFEYRLLLRPQIPHVGKVTVPEERVNLQPGLTRELHIALDREEGFVSTVALEIDGLPQGVSSAAGLARPNEKPPLPNGGRLERYTPKTQELTLLVTADTEAPGTPSPVPVRVYVRCLAEGALGSRILVKEMPLFIAPRKPS